MTGNFTKMVYEVFRKVIANLTPAELTDHSMVEAITMNENIRKEYGITFKASDIVMIAKANAAESVYRTIKTIIPEVQADPMYPDFPSQVMEMEEAEFRFHQMVHYFSTYGIEALFGVKVSKGWTPGEAEGVTKTPKTTIDKNLFSERVIDLLDEKDAYFWVYKTVLDKRERMTATEMALVGECLKHLTPEQVSSVSAAFKENLFIVFDVIIGTLNGEERVNTIRAICQNAGDLFKCADNYLHEKKWDISTSEKRAIVKAFELFEINDFKGNLMLSNVKREVTLKVLRFLDYNKYSRSEAHKKAVAMLRNKEMKSWEGRLKAALREDHQKGLSIAAERPGMLLRYVSMLIKAGVDPQQVEEALVENAEKLSTQTLVRLCTYFSNGACGFFEPRRRFDPWKDFDTDVLEDIFRHTLEKKLSTIETPIKGKKVYVESGEFALDHSILQANEKSEEGTYLPSGMSVRVPADAKRIRFFTYWNDEDRIDIDLHAYAEGNNKRIDIGWNRAYKDKEYGMVHSGDITWSNAAEFIDIDLETARKHGVRTAVFSLHCYTRKTFKEIDEVLVGLMAVSKLGEEKNAALYKPANCFWSHELKSDSLCITYGWLDLERMELTFIGKTTADWYEGLQTSTLPEDLPTFTVQSYLDSLIKAQEATLVDKDEAEVILRVDKGSDEREISLIDSNYWMDL